MSGNTVRETYTIDGMVCRACEERIKKILHKLNGIIEVRPDAASGTVTITYDRTGLVPDQIRDAFHDSGYTIGDQVSDGNPPAARLTIPQFVAIAAILTGIYITLRNTVGFAYLPEMKPSMGYGFLLLIGLLTSLHCVAMCGGISLSQCLPAGRSAQPGFAVMKTSLLYNAGRIVSYTMIGGLAGALGSAVSFSGWARGIIAIAAGLLMIVMGIGLSGVFPPLSRLVPRLPRFLTRRAAGAATGKGPLAVGLLNGLMPCGPLQTMQLYALGTGSAAAGALSMFFFSLGTVPLLLGLGAATTMLGRRFTGGMLKISAVLVIVLGVAMLDRGFLLSGIGFQ